MYPHWRVVVIGSLLLAALVAAAGLMRPAIPPPLSLASGARVEWTPCWFWVSPFDTVQCGYFSPSRARQPGTGEPIRLALVRIGSDDEAGHASPVLMLHGGPGYPLGLDRNGMRYWRQWFARQDWKRDLILFDQRGAGLSRPKIDCPEYHAAAREIIGRPLSIAEEYVYWARATRECHARLTSRGIDLSRFTTRQSAEDVGELMAVLGGSSWNLYAISYGTRLAQPVVRDFANRLRSVVLDSVYPLEANPLLSTPYLVDHAIDTIVQACRRDLRCRTAYPELESTIWNLFDRLQKHPITLEIPRPKPGPPITVAINDQRLLWTLYFSLYSWNLVETVPLAINAAAHGNYAPLVPLATEYVHWLFDEDFSDAVFLSVECHDLRPDISRTEYMAEVARFPRVRRFVEDGWEQNPCRLWDSGHGERAYYRPRDISVPALLLAGQYDPATPPVWAKIVGRRFTAGKVYLFPGIGHDVLGSDDCAAELVRDFFNVPNPEKQPSCVDDLRGTEFHIQFNSFISKENLMPPIDINLTTVVIVAALVFALGALWYSPVMFADSWMRYNGYTPKQIKAMNKKNGYWPLIVTAAAQFVMALILAILISYSGVATTAQGVSLGLLVWLGVAAPVGLINNMFSDKPINAFWLDAGFHAIALGIMGGVLSAWR